MAEADAPAPIRSLRSLVALIASVIASVTALVTACTSLVKAVDKRVEQASYETLSHKIVELQDESATLRHEVALLRASPSAEAPLPPPPFLAPAPSASLPMSFPDGGVPMSHPKIAGGGSPTSGGSHCPADDPLCEIETRPPPSLPAAAPPRSSPPPSWGDVKQRADRM